MSQAWPPVLDLVEIQFTSLDTSGMTVAAAGVSAILRSGWVQVRGTVTRSGTQTGPMFTLPTGWWPLRSVSCEALTPTGAIARVTATQWDGVVSVENSFGSGDFRFEMTFPAA